MIDANQSEATGHLLALTQLAPFRILPAAELTLLALAGREQVVPRRTVLVEAGELPGALYVPLRGQLELSTPGLRRLPDWNPARLGGLALLGQSGTGRGPRRTRRSRAAGGGPGRAAHRPRGARAALPTSPSRARPAAPDRPADRRAHLPRPAGPRPGEHRSRLQDARLPEATRSRWRRDGRSRTAGSGGPGPAPGDRNDAGALEQERGPRGHHPRLAPAAADGRPGPAGPSRRGRRVSPRRWPGCRSYSGPSRPPRSRHWSSRGRSWPQAIEDEDLLCLDLIRGFAAELLAQSTAQVSERATPEHVERTN